MVVVVYGVASCVDLVQTGGDQGRLLLWYDSSEVLIYLFLDPITFFNLVSP